MQQHFYCIPPSVYKVAQENCEVVRMEMQKVFQTNEKGMLFQDTKMSPECHVLE